MVSAEPRRGEVWLVSLGAGRSGEAGKNRPAVVISVDELNSEPMGGLIVIIPLSSSRASSALRPEVTDVEGLDRPSRVMCRGIRAVASTRLLRRLGAVEPVTLAEIERALEVVLGLSRSGAPK